MITTYSQPSLKPIYKERVSRLFELVKTQPTPDLWLKIAIFGHNRERWMNYGWGLSWERDSPQIKFFFGDRFKFDNISKQIEFKSWPRGKIGHYRFVEGHGFYDKEWSFIEKHPIIKHVITLKLAHNATDKEIAKLMAHEYRHYLQYKKFGLSMCRIGNNGRRSRPVQVERDANKWAEKRINKLCKEGRL